MKLVRNLNVAGTWAASRSAVLKTIYYRGPIKRSEIAQHLGLTMPTITTNINHMMAMGLVREEAATEAATNQIGRKARPVSIVPDARYFVGMEMRGFQRTICVQNFAGQTLYSHRDDRNCSCYEENLRVSCDMIRKAVAACNLTMDEISGIGFCVPGVVNSKTGMLDTMPSYDWPDKSVRADVAALTGYTGPISVENNACARAYGLRMVRRELLLDVPNFTYFFISRGISCPLLVETNSGMGSVVGAGEVGHMIMEANGRLCTCGNRGCLEAYSSDLAVVARCKEAMDQGKAPVLKRICGDLSPTMKLILEAQVKGDEAVADIVRDAVYRIGIAVANVVNFASPRIMFVDGQLFNVQENREQLLNTIHVNLCNALHMDTQFMFVEPDDFSGAAGAAALAIHNSLVFFNE